MSKKSIKIFSVALTVAVVFMMLTSTAFAINSPSEIDTSKTPTGFNKVESVGSSLVASIRTIGILISLGTLMILGIKYMMGSAEEKASYKKTMMPYVIGAVLLFGASTVADIVFNFANSLNTL